MGDEKKRIEGENERGKLWWWGEVAPVSVLRYINYRGREGEEGGSHLKATGRDCVYPPCKKYYP